MLSISKFVHQFKLYSMSSVCLQISKIHHQTSVHHLMFSRNYGNVDLWLIVKKNHASSNKITIKLFRQHLQVGHNSSHTGECSIISKLFSDRKIKRDCLFQSFNTKMKFFFKTFDFSQAFNMFISFHWKETLESLVQVKMTANIEQIPDSSAQTRSHSCSYRKTFFPTVYIRRLKLILMDNLWKSKIGWLFSRYSQINLKIHQFRAHLLIQLIFFKLGSNVFDAKACCWGKQWITCASLESPFSLVHAEKAISFCAFDKDVLYQLCHILYSYESS